MGSVLLAEDLLLLVTDDASGRLLVPAAQVDAGLGGANLAGLALLNKVDLSGEGEGGKPAASSSVTPPPSVMKSSTPPCKSSSRARAASRRWRSGR